MRHTVESTRRALWCVALLWPMAGHAVNAEEFGAIRGRFLLPGGVPKPVETIVDSDAKANASANTADRGIVVGADNGLANVVVYVRSKNIPTPPENGPEPMVIDVVGGKYVPHVAVLRTGQKLVIRNSDAVDYTHNFALVRNPAIGVMVPVEGNYIVSFDRAEDVPVRLTCPTRQSMGSWVLIRPNSYACVSKSSGAIEIARVPYGDWELQLWHEKCGWIDEVSINGAIQPVPKGRMLVKVDRDAKDFGDVLLDYDRLMAGPEAEPGVGADSR